MKIGIFGGSFNPPHRMHLKIVEHLLNNNYVDKVIMVPTGSKYKYKNNLESDNSRLEMLKLMTASNPNIYVSDYELKDYVVYTIDTLNHYKEENPNDEIYFICGADNLDYIDTWKNGIDILNNFKIIVVSRLGYNLDTIIDKYDSANIIVSPMSIDIISSTMIRELINNDSKDELTNYLDKDVIEYIQTNSLYKKR